jgi:hypothetical protein
MRFEGALINEQGKRFAVVRVPESIFESKVKIQQERARYDEVFPDVPIILVCQDSKGRTRYHGKTEIVRFLSKVGSHRIPWREYRITRNPESL